MNLNLYFIENINIYLFIIKVFKIELKLNYNEEVVLCGYVI